MYGTIARMVLKPGVEEQFKAQLSEFERARTPGEEFEYIYQTNPGANEYFLVVGFSSKEAYEANANSPEQHQRYLKYRQLLAEEPQWHDGEIVHTHRT